MIRAIRFFLRLCLALLLLTALCLVALWLAFTRSEYSRDWVAAAATRVLAAPVAIEGLGARWDDGPVVTAFGTRVLSADGEDAVHIQRLHIRLNPDALIRGRMEPREIELDAPRLRLETGRDGAVRLLGTERRLGAGRMPEPDRWFGQLAAGLRVRVDDGHLYWRTEGGREALEVGGIAVQGEIHEGVGEVRARAEVDGGGSLAMELRMEDAGASWRASLDGLVIDELARRLPLPLPDSSRIPASGVVAARVQGTWAQAPGAAMEIGLDWQSPSVTPRGKTGTVAADSIRLVADLRGDLERWQGEVHTLELRHGALAWDSPPWRIRGTGANARAVLERGVEVATIRSVLAVTMPEAPVTEYLLATAPSGWISGAKAGLDASRPYLEADVVGVQSRASDWIPGFERAAGRLRLEPGGGSWALSAPHLRLVLERLFRGPLELGAVDGVVHWRRVADGWHVHTGEVSLRSVRGDVDARLELDVPRDTPSWPQMRLSGTFAGLDATAVPEFLPVGKMPADAVQWLDRAVVAGRAERGSFVVEGPARRFPFPEGDGRFDVDAELSDVELDFAPGWPPLREASGRLRARRTALDAEVDIGRLRELDVTDVAVHIPDLDTPEPVVEIGGSGSGPLADIVDFLAHGPLGFGAGLRAVGMTGSGGGAMELDLSLPVRMPEEARIEGRFLFHDGGIRFASGIELEALRGGFEFTADSLSGGPVEGRMLGGPVRIGLETPRVGRDPLIRFRGEGVLDTGRLDPWIGNLLAGAFEGLTPWQGVLDVEAARADLRLQSDLTGARSHLPAPLGKDPETAWPTVAAFAYRDEHTRLDLEIEDRAHVIVDFDTVPGSREPNRIGVQVGSGRAALPREQGVEVRVQAPSMDADGWWNRWRAAEAAAVEAAGDDLPLLLLDARARETRWLGRALGAQHLQLAPVAPGHWQARIDGDAIAGGFELVLGERDRLELDLDRMHLPARPMEEEDEEDIDVDPATLPDLVARIGDLVWDDWHLGALRVEGGPTGDGWVARQVLLRRPELDGRGELRWTRHGGLASTSARLELETRDLGVTLEALGYGRQVNNGRGTLDMALSWNASPAAFSLARLDGTYRLGMAGGQVLSVEPGMGRLVGLFNAEAVFRRLTLDFTDVFGRGLAFDRIDSAGYFTGGRMHFTDHHLVGPAALIEFTGHSDLLARDYDIEMTVAPTYGGNLTTLLGGLASPAVGAAVYLAQRMFQRQIRRLVRSRYRITGSWDDPLVIPLGRLPAESGASAEHADRPDVQQSRP